MLTEPLGKLSFSHLQSRTIFEEVMIEKNLNLNATTYVMQKHALRRRQTSQQWPQLFKILH